jgi:hypothetical protein
MKHNFEIQKNKIKNDERSLILQMSSISMVIMLKHHVHLEKVERKGKL